MTPSVTSTAPARSAALQRFIDAADAIVGRDLPARETAAAVSEALRPALADPDLLAPCHREAWDDRYRQHLVYVHPEGRYSIVALVWNPGQATPIHDHIAWCVVGVHQGQETETRYLLMEADGERWLECEGISRYDPGTTTFLVPPDENIHKVENGCDSTSISIHVYGADIGRLGSSINECFGEPVVEKHQPGSRVAWRLSKT
jgi:predicted metal-dependent enzyme (double-stranded beta helix superfamily)